MFEEYLLSLHKKEIVEILTKKSEEEHYSININFVELYEYEPDIGNEILKNPEETLSECNQALINVQKKLLQTEDTNNFILKNSVHCRIHGLPLCPELHKTVFPHNFYREIFLQLTGIVIRTKVRKLLVYQKEYQCVKCKYVMIAKADYDLKYRMEVPSICENPIKCKSTNIVPVEQNEHQYCREYQEIKIQEETTKSSARSIPNSMWVTLEDDLVDTCKPGDNVTICGSLRRRWGPLIPGKRVDIEFSIKANHVQVNNEYCSFVSITATVKECFNNFWKKYEKNPLVGRNLILKSFCPQIYGLLVPKLAVAVVLARGSQVAQENEVNKTRSEAHILLIGDPGTGKSQLLNFASKVIPRSVLTTGIGSTSAGLTVAAIMENGEWHLEGGALVLADGGICCIDEFNSMKQHDRTSIHEAMEQQTISVAKAGLVCKFQTKCSILAAGNPKANLGPSASLSAKVALASPLLSRFDIVLSIKDDLDRNWDNLVADTIIKGTKKNLDKNKDLWNLETLQAYFSIIRKLNPLITSEAHEILSNYYQMHRRANSRDKARTTIRMLESLIRLSQGHAKLMFHTEVQIVDAVMAILLIELSMQEAALIFLPSNFNLRTAFTEDPYNEYKKIESVVLEKLNLINLLKNSTHNNENFMEVLEENATSNGELDHNEVFRKRVNKINETSGITNEEELCNVVESKDNEIKVSNVEIFKVPKHKPKKYKIDTEIKDLEKLNSLPSINDEFELNLDYEDVQENIEEEEEKMEVKEGVKTQESMEVEENLLNTKLSMFKEKFSFKPRTRINNPDCTNQAAGETSSKKSIFESEIDYDDLDI